MPTLLTSRFEDALVFTHQLHAQQIRKGNQTPYIAHLISVAALVLESGGDEDQAIAALLHDAVEDQGGLETLEIIRQRFGERVANIVEACTDSYTIPKPPWRARKEDYLAHLSQISPEARLVSLADKLHNARSILRDIKSGDVDIWDKFKGGKQGTLWYYRTLVKVFRQTGSNYMIDELDRVVTEIEQLATGQSSKKYTGEFTGGTGFSEKTTCEGSMPLFSASTFSQESHRCNMETLTLNQYQKLAARTAGAGGYGERRLIVATLGLTGEAGEFANMVKKLTAHGHEIPPDVLADELGDVLWYLAEAATTCGLDLGDIARQNVEKLKQRYPEGFSQERSINREV
jgi:NTP pyrophosphatase (non-canonical NTP hydrolase)